MRKYLSTLIVFPFILCVAACVSGTGAGVDPTPGDDHEERGAFGDGPSQGALGGAETERSGPLDAPAMCRDQCAMLESCGALEDQSQANCTIECLLDIGALSDTSVGCQTAYVSMFTCTLELSCEEFIGVWGDHSWKEDGACRELLSAVYGACAPDLADSVSVTPGDEDDEGDISEPGQGSDAPLEPEPAEEVPAEESGAE